ncbi:MAG: T9SS type A sorting domain-containing protein [Paludibacter sp.]|nr:T9SS type A sorting domain-containing protein [Paludibacter sp.]
MKKTTILCVFILMNVTLCFSQWQKMSLTNSVGGNIDQNMYQMALNNSKLYVATNDGIWESASANGGDWAAYGLQGKRVFMINFGVLKLAIVVEIASDDATKKTLQLYKYNGTAWVNTNFNPSKLAVFGNALDNLINFAQIQNNGQTVIVLPTWGNGIWRSADGGDTWTKPAYETCTTCLDNTSLFYKKIPGIYTFPGDTKIYGTDKADFNLQFMIYSEDYGLTWKNKPVANFFNPWSLHKRSVGGKPYFYWGGSTGSLGAVWTSDDAGTNWAASFALGAAYWNNRRIIGEDDGPLYIMCSADNVYVSNDNGDSFEPVGTGITIPSSVPRPANEPFFLSHLVKSSTKLYVSTTTDGLYSFDLAPSAVENQKTNKLKLIVSADKSKLELITDLASKIIIFNTEGKVMKIGQTQNIKTLIDIQDLKSAMYFVQIKNAQGENCTGKFVK